MPTNELFDRYDLEDDNPAVLLVSNRAGFQTAPEEWLPPDLTIEDAYNSNWASSRALELVANARSASKIGRVDDLITSIKKRIVEPYQFDVFKPDTYNFGIVTTYRQRWQPLNYQAGDLAGTLPLAPNERRDISWTQTRTTEDKSSTTTSRLRKKTSSEKIIARAESEITDKASRKMAAKLDGDASLKFGEWLELNGGSSSLRSRRQRLAR